MKKLTFAEIIATVPTTGNGQLQGQKARTKPMYVAGLTTSFPSDGEIISQQVLKAVGVTNFPNGNKLNAGTRLLVLGVRMRFDTTTASVTTKIATWVDDAPVQFKNGEIVVWQSGKGNLVELPIAQICKTNAALSTEGEYFPVVPFIIEPEIEFGFRVLPANATLTTGQAYKFELDCVALSDTDKS